MTIIPIPYATVASTALTIPQPQAQRPSAIGLTRKELRDIVSHQID